MQALLATATCAILLLYSDVHVYVMFVKLIIGTGPPCK